MVGNVQRYPRAGSLVHMYINFSTSLHMSKYVSNNNIIIIISNAEV